MACSVWTLAFSTWLQQFDTAGDWRNPKNVPCLGVDVVLDSGGSFPPHRIQEWCCRPGQLWGFHDIRAPMARVLHRPDVRGRLLSESHRAVLILVNGKENGLQAAKKTVDALCHADVQPCLSPDLEIVTVGLPAQLERRLRKQFADGTVRCRFERRLSLEESFFHAVARALRCSGRASQYLGDVDEYVYPAPSAGEHI